MGSHVLKAGFYCGAELSRLVTELDVVIKDLPSFLPRNVAHIDYNLTLMHEGKGGLLQTLFCPFVNIISGCKYNAGPSINHRRYFRKNPIPVESQRQLKLSDSESVVDPKELSWIFRVPAVTHLLGRFEL